MSKKKFRGNRMNLQSKQENLRKSKSELERKEKNLESKKYWSDKEESYLERMRIGYAEGAKLYFDSFKTRATLAASSILVVLALSNSVVQVPSGYDLFMWLSCTLLAVSMVASITTMDVVTNSVFTTLVNEEAPTRIRDGTEILDENTLSERYEEQNNKIRNLSRLASYSFFAGIGLFGFYIIVPTIVMLLGLGN